MATFKTSKDTILDLTMVEVSGKLSAAEIIDWLVQYYRKPPTTSILWDYRKADLSAGNLEAIEEILTHVLESGKVRPLGKTALVFDDDNSLKLGEIFSDRVVESGHEVVFRAFLDAGDAISWLSE